MQAHDDQHDQHGRYDGSQHTLLGEESGVAALPENRSQEYQ